MQPVKNSTARQALSNTYAHTYCGRVGNTKKYFQ